MIPCEQTERIGRIETAVEKLAQTVTVMASDVRMLNANVEMALRKVDEQEHTLQGEDHHGLIVMAKQATFNR